MPQPSVHADRPGTEWRATRIEAAEAEINDRVYRLFDLSADDIRLIEDSIAGHY